MLHVTRAKSRAPAHRVSADSVLRIVPGPAQPGVAASRAALVSTPSGISLAGRTDVRQPYPFEPGSLRWLYEGLEFQPARLRNRGSEE